MRTLIMWLYHFSLPIPFLRGLDLVFSIWIALSIYFERRLRRKRIDPDLSLIFCSADLLPARFDSSCFPTEKIIHQIQWHFQLQNTSFLCLIWFYSLAFLVSFYRTDAVKRRAIFSSVPSCLIMSCSLSMRLSFFQDACISNFTFLLFAHFRGRMAKYCESLQSLW